jgi:hypothetical protein
MGLSTVRDDLMPPSFSRRYSSFGTQISLHTQAATAATSPPAGIEHLPCQVIVEADIGDIFAYIDAAGVTNSIAFLVAGTFAYRMAPATIETTTDVVAVTVFWNPEP